VGHTDDLERALKTVEDGLAYGQAHPITLAELKAERQAWLDQHFGSLRNNPVNSGAQHARDWRMVRALQRQKEAEDIARRILARREEVVG
jgi:hypothetical protein